MLLRGSSYGTYTQLDTAELNYIYQSGWLDRDPAAVSAIECIIRSRMNDEAEIGMPSTSEPIHLNS